MTIQRINQRFLKKAVNACIAISLGVLGVLAVKKMFCVAAQRLVGYANNANPTLIFPVGRGLRPESDLRLLCGLT
jgi:malonyl CoA-acyl carrier protein transacylase